MFGTFGARRSALEWARAQATRRGFPPATDKVVQIVFDGETCLEQGCRELFRGAILTLDIRHAQEKLWEVGRLFHREGSAELAGWVGELEGLLYKGHARTLVRRLEQDFSDILKSGTFEQVAALPAENSEPHLAHLSRLKFRFDRHSLGRLRMLIDAINREG